MKHITKFIKTITKTTTIYPLLLSVFPILALYNTNIEYVHYSSISRSIWFTIVVTSILLLISNVFIRKHHKAAHITSLIIFLFFTYGHFFTYLENKWPDSIRNLHVTGLWGILFLGGAWLIVRRASNPEGFSRFLARMSVILFVISIVQVTWFEAARIAANMRNRQQVAVSITNDLPITPEQLPDIYYIILDAHTRSDVLLKEFGYDNSDFIGELTELGFYVADCSQTNYWRTEYSISSSLNLDYVQDFLAPPYSLPDWKYSVVRQTLGAYGYKTVSFETRASHHVDLGEDVLLSRQTTYEIYEDIYPFSNLNEFEAMLIKTTWLQSFLQLAANFQNRLPKAMILDADNAAYLEHYRQTLFILDELERVPYLEGPKFVMVHLLLPHEPFIFHPSGRYEFRHTQDEFTTGYRNNAQFIDMRLGKILEKVIERSSVPPIILVQGDHGPNGSKPEILMPILNAYYLPGGGDERLYETITPANSFRIIFDHYFGKDYELLEDVSYYSSSAEFQDYSVVPNTCVLNQAGW